MILLDPGLLRSQKLLLIVDSSVISVRLTVSSSFYQLVRSEFDFLLFDLEAFESLLAFKVLSQDIHLLIT